MHIHATSKQREQRKPDRYTTGKVFCSHFFSSFFFYFFPLFSNKESPEYSSYQFSLGSIYRVYAGVSVSETPVPIRASYFCTLRSAQSTCPRKYTSSGRAAILKPVAHK